MLSRAKFFCFWPKNWKSANFLSFGQSCWNCIYKLQKLTAFERRTVCRIAAMKSCISHLFGGGPKPNCSDSFRAGIIESHNFFVLGPILVKFHIRTRLIESFPTIFRLWCCAEKSCTSNQVTPYANRSVTKRVSTNSEGRRVSNEVPAVTCTRVLGGRQNLEIVRSTVWEL